MRPLWFYPQHCTVIDQNTNLLYYGPIRSPHKIRANLLPIVSSPHTPIYHCGPWQARCLRRGCVWYYVLSNRDLPDSSIVVEGALVMLVLLRALRPYLRRLFSGRWVTIPNTPSSSATILRADRELSGLVGMRDIPLLASHLHPTSVTTSGVTRYRCHHHGTHKHVPGATAPSVPQSGRRTREPGDFTHLIVRWKKPVAWLNEMRPTAV